MLELISLKSITDLIVAGGITILTVPVSTVLDDCASLQRNKEILRWHLEEEKLNQVAYVLGRDGWRYTVDISALIFLGLLDVS